MKRRYLIILGLALSAVCLPSPAEARGPRTSGVSRRPSSTNGPKRSARSSEFLHQAQAGRWELAPGLSLTYSVLNDASGAKETRFGHPLALSAEYGFSRLFALALHLRHDSVAVSTCSAGGNCSSRSSSGVFDPNADFKFRSAMGRGWLVYGANISYAIERFKVQSSGDSNNATGGAVITPFLGYEQYLAGGRGGVKISHETYKGERQAEDSGVPYIVSGGVQLSAMAFFENRLAPTIYGGALQLKSSTARSGMRSDTGQTVDYNDAYTQAAVLGYAAITSSSSMVWLPSLRLVYDRFSNGSSFIELEGGAKLRVIF